MATRRPSARSKPAGRRKAGARSSPVRAPVGLSHQLIRREALRLIDQDGIDAFSTRKLGRALGCEAMAIYWYYRSKEALLDAVVDELMSRIEVGKPGAARDWVDALRDVAHAYRDLAHRHPRAFPLLATRRFATEATYGFLESLFELARQKGLSDQESARFFRAVSSYCSGIALNELATQRQLPGLSPSELKARFPRVAAAQVWFEPEHHDEVFDFGLEILLEALARSAGGEGGRRPRARSGRRPKRQD